MRTQEQVREAIRYYSLLREDYERRMEGQPVEGNLRIHFSKKVETMFDRVLLLLWVLGNGEVEDIPQ